MASKDKKNLNKNKGKCIRKNNHRFNPCKLHGAVRGGGKWKYCAPDSCTIINILKRVGIEKPKQERRYDKRFNYLGMTEQQTLALDDLIDNSVYRSDGSINPRGKHVLCVLPTVYWEITNKVKDECHRKEIDEFINNRMLVIRIKPEFKEKFKELKYALAHAYTRAGYHVGEDGKPNMDAFALAEASILNVVLVSLDTDFVSDRKTRYYIRKDATIREINREILGKGLSGLQAKPSTLVDFVKGNIVVPRIENVGVLTKELQTELFGPLKYVPPFNRANREIIRSY